MTVILATMNRHELALALPGYHTSFDSERAFIPLFLKLLDHPRAYYRDHLPGHMTGSSWIIDETHQFVLLTHHAKLDRWLQPGGHADGDEDIYDVALREAREETGIKDFTLLSHGLFDIDIHAIPARAEFPQHDHYDIRFLLQCSKEDTLVVTEESQALEWVDLREIASKTGNNESMLRMAEKVRNLFTAQQK